METATEQAMKRDEKAVRENVLEQRIRHFVEAWAPDDRRDAAEFHYELIGIVRAIYDEAVEKPHAIMMKMVDAIPIRILGDQKI